MHWDNTAQAVVGESLLLIVLGSQDTHSQVFAVLAHTKAVTPAFRSMSIIEVGIHCMKLRCCALDYVMKGELHPNIIIIAPFIDRPRRCNLFMDRVDSEVLFKTACCTFKTANLTAELSPQIASCTEM